MDREKGKKGKKRDCARAYVGIYTRPARRRLRTCVYIRERAPHGAMRRRPTECTGHPRCRRNKNTRKSARTWKRGRETNGGGTSDSNYPELRADSRPIQPGVFLPRATAHAVTLLPIVYRPRTDVIARPGDTVRIRYGYGRIKRG